MYGGFSTNVCNRHSLIIANVEYGPDGEARNALTIGHELSHALGAGDIGGQVCDPDCHPPALSIMSEDAGRLCKEAGYQCDYHALSAYQIKGCLGLRRGSSSRRFRK